MFFQNKMLIKLCSETKPLSIPPGILTNNIIIRHAATEHTRDSPKFNVWCVVHKQENCSIFFVSNALWLVLWHTDSCWWNFPHPSSKKKVLMTFYSSLNIQDQKFIQKQKRGGAKTQPCQSSWLTSLNYITLLTFNHHPPLSKNWIEVHHCCSHMTAMHINVWIELEYRYDMCQAAHSSLTEHL